MLRSVTSKAIHWSSPLPWSMIHTLPHFSNYRTAPTEAMHQSQIRIHGLPMRVLTNSLPADENPWMWLTNCNENLAMLVHKVKLMVEAPTKMVKKTWSFDLWTDYIFTLLFEDMHTIHVLTHWGRVTHICVSKLTIIGSDNGLSPDRRQAIIWTNAGLLLIGPLGTNFSEILIEILTFSIKKMRLKVSSGKWRPFCLGLNELSSVVVWCKFILLISFTDPRKIMQLPQCQWTEPEHLGQICHIYPLENHIMTTPKQSRRIFCVYFRNILTKCA